MHQNSVLPAPLSGRPTDVVVRYNGGAVVRESWMVAEKAIERGQARRIDPPKQESPASQR